MNTLGSLIRWFIDYHHSFGFSLFHLWLSIIFGFFFTRVCVVFFIVIFPFIRISFDRLLLIYIFIVLTAIVLITIIVIFVMIMVMVMIMWVIVRLSVGNNAISWKISIFFNLVELSIETVLFANKCFQH